VSSFGEIKTLGETFVHHLSFIIVLNVGVGSQITPQSPLQMAIN